MMSNGQEAERNDLLLRIDHYLMQRERQDEDSGDFCPECGADAGQSHEVDCSTLAPSSQTRTIPTWHPNAKESET